MPKVEVDLKDKLLLSVDEAAAMLSTSAPTLRGMVKAGIIRRLEIRGVTKFYTKELHKFCEEMLDKGVDPSAPADEIIRELS